MWPLATLVDATFDHSTIASRLSHQMQKFSHPRFFDAMFRASFFNVTISPSSTTTISLGVWISACAPDSSIECVSWLVGVLSILLVSLHAVAVVVVLVVQRFRSDELANRVDPVTVGWKPETNSTWTSTDPWWIGRNVRTDWMVTRTR